MEAAFDEARALASNGDEDASAPGEEEAPDREG